MNVNSIPAMSALDDVESSYPKEHDEHHRSFKNRRVDSGELTERSREGISCDRDPRRWRLNLLSQATDLVKEDVSRDEDEISVTGEKMMTDFQTETCKLKEFILKNRTSDDQIAQMNKTSLSTDEDEAISPTLKSKSKERSTYNTPPPDAICTEGINVAVDPPSMKKSTPPTRSIEKKEERPRFSVSLSREEIEEDFISITGKKPPLEPKKRPTSIQNKLQALCPGSQLSEVFHPDRYVQGRGMNMERGSED